MPPGVFWKSSLVQRELVAVVRAAVVMTVQVQRERLALARIWDQPGSEVGSNTHPQRLPVELEVSLSLVWKHCKPLVLGGSDQPLARVISRLLSVS